MSLKYTNSNKKFLSYKIVLQLKSLVKSFPRKNKKNLVLSETIFSNCQYVEHTNLLRIFSPSINFTENYTCEINKKKISHVGSI